mgnify:CR=1 FL=1
MQSACSPHACVPPASARYPYQALLILAIPILAIPILATPPSYHPLLTIPHSPSRFLPSRSLAPRPPAPHVHPPQAFLFPPLSECGATRNTSIIGTYWNFLAEATTRPGVTDTIKGLCLRHTCPHPVISDPIRSHPISSHPIPSHRIASHGRLLGRIGLQFPVDVIEYPQFEKEMLLRKCESILSKVLGGDMRDEG